MAAMVMGSGWDFRQPVRSKGRQRRLATAECTTKCVKETRRQVRVLNDADKKVDVIDEPGTR